MKFPPSVRLDEIVPGYPVIEVNHAGCRGRIALHGAQVMEWQPAGEEPVIYLSPDAVFREGKAIRGGIPVCWPWFNAHPSDPRQPSHGIARTRFWTLDDVSEDESGVTVRLSMNEGPWGAVVTVRMGSTLGVALESTNLGDSPLAISGALHSYLHVADIGRVRIDGLADTAYLDTVGTPAMRRQLEPLVIDREVDRIYASTGPVEVIDEVLDRTIVVSKSGSPSTVVWNPWSEKGAALGDLPDRDFRRFVCVEAAISNDRALELSPGERSILATTIHLSR